MYHTTICRSDGRAFFFTRSVHQISYSRHQAPVRSPPLVPADALCVAAAHYRGQEDDFAVIERLATWLSSDDGETGDVDARSGLGWTLAKAGEEK